MERLTKEEIKECTPLVMASQMGRVYGKTLTKRIMSELLEYKCAEEELGVDFITLFKVFKALKNGAWFINPHDFNEMNYVKNLEFNVDFDKKCFELRTGWYINSIGGALFFFKDYGRTWGLTKKELEHDR